MLYSCVREYSVRRYLDGFSDAIVPNSVPEATKSPGPSWIGLRARGRREPRRRIQRRWQRRDPEITLTYRQLLNVCGTATNAFLNLARSSDLRVRRLLLLSPDRQTKHVVAEVLINQRWIIVDPTYRIIMKDAKGNFMTRQGIAESSHLCAGYWGYPELSAGVQTTTNSRIYGWARLPLEGLHLRRLLEPHQSGVGRSGRLEFTPRARIFFLSGGQRRGDAVLPAFKGGTGLVRGQPFENSTFSSARACRPSRCRLLLPRRRLNSSVCGICGVAFASRSGDAEARVRAMTAAMRHRGPDEEGFLAGDARAPGLCPGDAPAKHHRSGRRPPSPPGTKPRDVAVICNGELYNYRDLRERLTLCGHRFSTQSDTEISGSCVGRMGRRLLDRTAGYVRVRTAGSSRALRHGADPVAGTGPAGH